MFTIYMLCRLLLHLSNQCRNGRSRAKEAYFVLYLFCHTVVTKTTASG